MWRTVSEGVVDVPEGRVDARDADLIVVASVEEFGARHDMPSDKVVALFKENGIMRLLRDHYDVLHTQDLGEGASFAEDWLAVKGVAYG